MVQLPNPFWKRRGWNDAVLQVERRYNLKASESELFRLLVPGFKSRMGQKLRQGKVWIQQWIAMVLCLPTWWEWVAGWWMVFRNWEQANAFRRFFPRETMLGLNMSNLGTAVFSWLSSFQVYDLPPAMWSCARAESSILSDCGLSCLVCQMYPPTLISWNQIPPRIFGCVSHMSPVFLLTFPHLRFLLVLLSPVDCPWPFGWEPYVAQPWDPVPTLRQPLHITRCKRMQKLIFLEWIYCSWIFLCNISYNVTYDIPGDMPYATVLGVIVLCWSKWQWTGCATHIQTHPNWIHG